MEYVLVCDGQAIGIYYPGEEELARVEVDDHGAVYRLDDYGRDDRLASERADGSFRATGRKREIIDMESVDDLAIILT